MITNFKHYIRESSMDFLGELGFNKQVPAKISDTEEQELKKDSMVKKSAMKSWATLPNWKQDGYTAFIFSLRMDGSITPDSVEPPSWRIDTWMEVDYENPDQISKAYPMMQLRARANNAFMYGIWLPNDIAEDIDKKDRPEDYMDLIMKYKFEMNR